MKKLFTIFSTLLILALAGGITYELQVAARKLPVRQFFPADKTVAVWDWQNPTTRSQGDLDKIDQFFYLHQINTVYVDISPYADIKKNNDQAKQQQLEDSLARYVKTVKKHKVRVFAAAGNTDWSK